MRLTWEPMTLKLATAFNIAHGSYTERHNVLARLEHDGLTGLGEAAVVPYLGESREGVTAYLAQAADALGDDPWLIEDILDRLPDGSHAAQSALSLCLYDLHGQRLAVQDAVHPPQVHDHLAPLHRCRRAITDILAGGNRVHRDPLPVEHFHDFLDFFRAARRNDGGGCVLLVRHGHHDFFVRRDFLVINDDVVRADNARDLLERLLEGTGVYAFRQDLTS